MSDGRSSPHDHVRVLFDGGCPLCRREIAHYRRRRGAGAIDWIDLAPLAPDAPIDGIDWHTAMARLHVRDIRGQWHTGARAFVELWTHLRGYRHIARLVRALHLLPLLDRLYERFARRRYAARCSDLGCEPPPETSA